MIMSSRRILASTQMDKLENSYCYEAPCNYRGGDNNARLRNMQENVQRKEGNRYEGLSTGKNRKNKWLNQM